ncbi:MAG: DUF4160 domain-containing protein [Sulfuricella sp.]|nr:DUF4160 domain-containing protein [Sulfuricella sp.]
MPAISMFYGIIISMYFMDNQRHHFPHIHVEYQGVEAIIALPSGELLEGQIPTNKLKLVQAWIEIHQEELMMDWTLALRGAPVFKIEPLH